MRKVFLSFALAPLLAAAAPQVVNNCTTLAQPGSYVVNRNLNANGDCLVVAADFVTIDLDGFVISGNGTGAAVTQTPLVARRGITVRNGTVTGFQNGIALADTTAATVERVFATANLGHGIVVGDASNVSNNRAHSNGGDGIRVGIGGHVLANTVGRNQGSGISTVEGANVLNNVSRNNRLHGISMDCPGLAMGNTASNSMTGDNFHDVSGGCVVKEHNSFF